MNRPIRVLHLLHSFNTGGLENGLVNLINQSPDHISHELLLLKQGGAFLERLKKPVLCRQLRKRPGNDVRIVFQILQILRETRPDVLHTRNWAAFDGVLAACLVSRVVVLHGEHGRDLSDPQGEIGRRNLLRRLLHYRIRKFVTVSDDLRRWLQEVVGIPSQKLEVIPNGVDTGRFSPRPWEGIRELLGIRHGEFVVGMFGRLDPVKNHAGLIRAVRELERRKLPIRLLIVGGGPEEGRIRTLISALGFECPPILLGFRSDVENLYNALDAFVLNSFAEGMSNTVLEAMASQLPVICTDVGGNPELVKSGVRGTLVPPGRDDLLASAIQAYYHSPGLGQTHGKHGRSYIEGKHSLALMVQRYMRLYEIAPVSAARAACVVSAGGLK